MIVETALLGSRAVGEELTISAVEGPSCCARCCGFWCNTS